MASGLPEKTDAGTKVAVRSRGKGGEERSGAIRPRNPDDLRDVDRWFDEFGRRFERAWPSVGQRFGPRGARGRWMAELPGTRRPFADLVDSGDCYRVMVEVPGIPKEKLKVAVTDREATIQGEARTDVHEEREGYVRRERGYSRVSRTVVFPEPVLGAKAEASVTDGVLELRVPKKEPAKSATHRVAVK